MSIFPHVIIGFFSFIDYFTSSYHPTSVSDMQTYEFFSYGYKYFLYLLREYLSLIFNCRSVAMTRLSIIGIYLYEYFSYQRKGQSFIYKSIVIFDVHLPATSECLHVLRAIRFSFACCSRFHELQWSVYLTFRGNSLVCVPRNTISCESSSNCLIVAVYHALERTLGLIN